jgi:TPR repeat protein
MTDFISFLIAVNVADAIAALSWGQWKKGLQILTFLSSIGFMPAKTYFDPALSPAKNPTEWYHIAMTLNSHNQPRVAATWIRKSAKAGEPQAMLELAKFLVVGRGGSEASGKLPDEDDENGDGADEGQAMVWFHRAWDKRGFSDAAFGIGQLYAQGLDGDLEDDDETRSFASPWGGSMPWESLDPDLASGKSVNRDMEKAVFWWMRAADLSHAGAQACLAEAKLVGADGKQARPDQAIQWLKKAVKGGVPRAMFVLGLCLKMGVGCKKNIESGTNWLRQAADQGFSEGVSPFAESLSSQQHQQTDASTGTPHKKKLKDVSLNNIKALSNGVELLRKSAQAGSPMAMYVLGLCLQSGFGTFKNEKEGIDWLAKAAANGWTQWGGGGEISETKALMYSSDAAETAAAPTVAELRKAIAGEKVTGANPATGGDALLETAGDAWSIHHGGSKLSKVSPELIAAAEAAARAATGGSALRPRAGQSLASAKPSAIATNANSSKAAATATGATISAVSAAALIDVEDGKPSKYPLKKDSGFDALIDTQTTSQSDQLIDISSKSASPTSPITGIEEAFGTSTIVMTLPKSPSLEAAPYPPIYEPQFSTVEILTGDMDGVEEGVDLLA